MIILTGERRDYTYIWKVALKLLTQRFPGDKSGIAGFQQEAHTLLALNHPHIMTIYDIDQIEGVYYIASELG